MATELNVLIPVAHRPHRVRLVLKSLRAATEAEYKVLFLPDPEDEEELAAILSTDADFMPVQGNYAEKINAGVEMTQAPLLFFGADDLHFHKGWLEAAKEKLTPGIGVVATNDLLNPRVESGTLATHPLTTREYVEQGTVDDPTKPLHEGYPHEYVDREFSETAQAREAFVYAPDSIVEHLHPLAKKAPWDDIYRPSKQRMRQGLKVYRKRRKLWT